MRIFAGRFLIALLCALAALAVEETDAVAGVHLALVLGNSKYQAAPELENPSNDAADLAKALRGIGFEVIEERDSTRDAMARAVRDFSSRLSGADVALFFYAGHGMQMNGENYLLPVDAKIETPADVRFNTINLTDIQQEMEGAGRANIIILDACRNNPFIERLSHGGRAAPDRGLGRVEAMSQGSLIVYSTQPNNIALDGAGRNSPFTSALLKHIATPGIEVRQMISRVRGDVLLATAQKQTPWDSSSLVGDVYLAAPPKPNLDSAPSAAPSTVVLPQTAPVAVEQAASAAAQSIATTNPQRVAAPDPPAIASGPEVECERLAAPPPPFATPDQLKVAKTRDFNRAIVACETASNANPRDSRLQFLLGDSYGTAKKYLEALPHYRAAAEAGYPAAQNALGVLFATGRGVVKDYQRAFDLIGKAAAAGWPDAIGNLGSMYANGNYVREDDAKALDLYEKSIEAGNSFALAQAGSMYFGGKGTERDFNAAAQYFQQAADLNDGYSLKFLAVMYERGLLGQANPAKAAELRLRAAQVDPTSQDPVVALPQKVAPAPRRAAIRYLRIRRYRFYGCSWLWC